MKLTHSKYALSLALFLLLSALVPNSLSASQGVIQPANPQDDAESNHSSNNNSNSNNNHPNNRHDNYPKAQDYSQWFRLKQQQQQHALSHSDAAGNPSLLNDADIKRAKQRLDLEERMTRPLQSHVLLQNHKTMLLNSFDVQHTHQQRDNVLPELESFNDSDFNWHHDEVYPYPHTHQWQTSQNHDYYVFELQTPHTLQRSQDASVFFKMPDVTILPFTPIAAFMFFAEKCHNSNKYEVLARGQTDMASGYGQWSRQVKAEVDDWIGHPLETRLHWRNDNPRSTHQRQHIPQHSHQSVKGKLCVFIQGYLNDERLTPVLYALKPIEIDIVNAASSTVDDRHPIIASASHHFDSMAHNMVLKLNANYQLEFERRMAFIRKLANTRIHQLKDMEMRGELPNKLTQQHETDAHQQQHLNNPSLSQTESRPKPANPLSRQSVTPLSERPFHHRRPEAFSRLQAHTSKPAFMHI